MATRTARPTASASPPRRQVSLSDVTTKGSGLPNRYILHGPEKTGKTSFAAFAPHPVFVETKGETGLETLIDAKRLPEVSHFPEVMSWNSLLGVVEALRTQDHSFKTLVIDTLNGAERLCHEHVCQRDFENNWGEKGFAGYQRGFEVSLADWRHLLAELDRLRAEKSMMIFGLCHTKIKTFSNPEGSDYDRYRPDMHDKTWGLSHKWADVILFLNYETFVNENDPTKKGKATGTQTRILFTERHAAYDAGNRLGLPPEIEMGMDGKTSWQKFREAVVAARNGSNAQGEK